MSEINQPLSID